MREINDETAERMRNVAKKLVASMPEHVKTEMQSNLVSDFMDDVVAKLTLKYMFIVEQIKDLFDLAQKEAEEVIGLEMARLQEKYIMLYQEMEGEKADGVK